MTVRFPPWGITAKITAANVICVMAAIGLTGVVFIIREHRHLIDMFGREVEAIAATAAVHLSGEMGDLHEQLVDDSDLNSDAWRRWRDALTEIREANGLSEDIYTFRAGGIAIEPLYQLRFVARSYDPRPGHEGRFIGEPYGSRAVSQREALHRAQRECCSAHTGIYSDGLSDRRWISAYAPIRNSSGEMVGFLDIDVDAQEHHLALRAEISQFIIFAGAVLAGALVLSILLSRTLSRPTRLLADASRALACGDFAHPLRVTTRDEIGELAATFLSMREKLQRAQQEAVRQTHLAAIVSSKWAIVETDGTSIPMARICGHVSRSQRADSTPNPGQPVLNRSGS